MQSQTSDQFQLSLIGAIYNRVDGFWLAVLAAFGIAMALLLWRLWGYVHFVASLLPLPYSIDYGEGIVMQQAMMIPGPRMYGDINVYPYIVFHYPPIYHLIVRAIQLIGSDLLYAGRWVSMSSTVTTAIFVGALIFCSIRPRVSGRIATIAAIFGGATVFTYVPVAFWSPLMRVDMLAVALSFAGVFLAVLGARRSVLLYPAALAFALSIYTKQTMIAAPVAVFGAFWLRDPRLVRWPLALSLGLSAAALVYLSWATNGGFLRHIVLYNVNRFDITHALPLLLGGIGTSALYLFVAIRFGLAFSWRCLLGSGRANIRELIRQSDEALILVMVTAWFCVATITLFTLGKSGAAFNYFIESMCIWSVLIGVAVGNALDVMWGGSATIHGRAGLNRRDMVLLVPLLLSVQLFLIPLPDTTPFVSAPTRQAMDRLFRMVQDTEKPVLSDDMVLLLRAGKQVPIEPSIFAELGSLRQWDQRKLVELISSHTFAFIISQYGLYDERYTRTVQAAITENYPHQERYAGYVVMKP
jgi:hypothetical protein